MQYVLIAMALTIVVLYLPYLFDILAGKPQSFETKAVLSLAVWIRDAGPKSRRYMGYIYAAAVLMEAAYFTLAWLVIGNTFLRGFTLAVAIFEVFHLTKEVTNLNNFFKGQLPVKDFLPWKYERASCLLFSLYTILVLVNLLTPI